MQSIKVFNMRRYALALFLGISSSCTDSSAPADLVGKYTLDRINNAVPPQLASATISCDLLITGGRLELRTVDWSGLIVNTKEDCSPAGGTITLDSIRYLGTFRTAGATLIFETLRSLEDTLRFTGPITFGKVTLAVSDAMRGLPGPIAMQFGPRQPL